MNKESFKKLTWVSKYLGMWLPLFIGWFITTWVFLTQWSRVRTSARFYAEIFSGKGRLFYLYCAWKQFHSFTTVFMDRIRIANGRRFDYNREGWEHIEAARQSGEGAILLMSHLGNWEMAAHLLRNQNLSVMLIMGERESDQIERLQKEDLAKEGVRIVSTKPGDSSAFNLLESVTFLKSGGFVSMAGDRQWKRGEAGTVSVKFLSREVSISRAPYAFAMTTGAPLIIFFALRVSSREYRFILSSPIYVKPESRAKRDSAIREAAQKYASFMEIVLREAPFQWYHFDPFGK